MEDRERMVKDLSAAKSLAEAKAGEIAIIRANQARLEKDYQHQLDSLRNRMAEQMKKHQAEVDAAATDRERIATEKNFLVQELREETHRVKEMQKAKKAQENQPPVTPKKNKSLPLRDGFDNDEMVSPTKSVGKRSKRAATAGPTKRKRRAIEDSPVHQTALQLSPTLDTSDGVIDEAAEPANLAIPEQDTKQKPKKEDRNSKFIRAILNHRTHPNDSRDLEVFTTLSFPSELRKSFASIVLEKTTKFAIENYTVEYARTIIFLWKRALDEKFYKPVSMLMNIITFILDLDPPSIAPQLTEDLIPVIQTSAYINGVSRFRNSPVSHLSMGQIRQTPRSELNYEVDSTKALNILYLVAGGCDHDINAIRKFWEELAYDFVLIMMNCYQPICEITTVMNTLSYSILPTTFGCIQKTDVQQTFIEGYFIDRITNLLSEQPGVDEGEEPYSPEQILTLRIEAVSLLAQAAFSAPEPGSSPAGRTLATHPCALARVFRALHDELDALYSNPPERELHVFLVNKLTQLLYGIMQSFRAEVNLPTKLRNVPGATQKHLVVLTRLAFSDALLLEEGIEEETIEMAHEMLEEAVNPQEAEALLEAFRPKSES